ncbi:DUF6093 family protein [Phycicoccus sp. 3266]|uniref:DUF6093 family protein n=1 Tax=Phycicoccus sp. 3266 TaxID=2817751 RepID=UPI002856514C|nr:DUF6093 family protein [Phycicoccus sp. 3266]MDR6861971.1 hypothetical protein [Phycicoccus sp. 3266]
MRGQAAALAMMQDTCEITVPGAGRGPLNPDTGQREAPAPVTLYSGPCRVRQPNLAAAEADAAGQALAVSDRIVSIPLAGDGYTEQGRAGIPARKATVRIVTVNPTGDPELAGRSFSYEAPMAQQSYPTARRMRCKEAE